VIRCNAGGWAVTQGVGESGEGKEESEYGKGI